MITKAETQKIYADHGIDLSDKDADEITAEANENGEKNHRGLDAYEWVMRWAYGNFLENLDCPSFSERLEYDFSQN